MRSGGQHSAQFTRAFSTATTHASVWVSQPARAGEQEDSMRRDFKQAYSWYRYDRRMGTTMFDNVRDQAIRSAVVLAYEQGHYYVDELEPYSW